MRQSQRTNKWLLALRLRLRLRLLPCEQKPQQYQRVCVSAWQRRKSNSLAFSPVNKRCVYYVQHIYVYVYNTSIIHGYTVYAIHTHTHDHIWQASVRLLCSCGSRNERVSGLLATVAVAVLTDRYKAAVWLVGYCRRSVRRWSSNNTRGGWCSVCIW